jgi:hypothetical protein
VVKLRSSTTPKIFDRGKLCMFVGYGLNHAADALRMWDPDTKKVYLTRDISCLKKCSSTIIPTLSMFQEGPTKTHAILHPTTGRKQSRNKSDLNNEFQIDKDNDKDIANNSIIENTKTTRSGRVIEKPERFQEELKNLLIEEEENYEENKLLEMICVGAGIGAGILHTNELYVLKYKEAMRGTDQECWTNTINEEHERMIENKVWKPIKQKDLLVDAKLLSTKWAMKKKANGKYRARITARGFLQGDGVHYFSHSTSAPVADELTTKIERNFLFLTTWKAQVIDVKGAFLK